MEKLNIVLFLLVTFSSIAFGEPKKLWNATNVDRLKADLLTGYDPLTRPENFNVATGCWIGLTVLNMELDETKGILETHAWLRMTWNDSKLKWDTKEYDGITQLNVAADELWTPDVMVYNSAEANIVDHFAKTHKLIYPSGTVLWVPTFKSHTYCKMDLKFWPFDDQKCEIKLGSWTFSALQINLQPDKNPVSIEYYNSIEWELVSTSAERHEKKYECCEEPYIDVTFYLNFRRRSPMFKVIAMVPAIVVVIMTLVSFWLPPQAGEKLLLNGIACIMVCLLLMYLSQLLPIMASSSPLIVTFYSHTLYLLCVSFILSTLVINISRNVRSKAVPSVARKIFLEGILGNLSSGGAIKKENQAEAHSVENNVQTSGTETKVHSIQDEWTRLAIAIDRIAFIIYLIIFILMGFYHFI